MADEVAELAGSANGWSSNTEIIITYSITLNVGMMTRLHIGNVTSMHSKVNSVARL